MIHLMWITATWDPHDKDICRHISHHCMWITCHDDPHQMDHHQYCLFYKALLQKRPIILRSLLRSTYISPLHVDHMSRWSTSTYFYTCPFRMDMSAQHTATHCATHCNTLRNALQHTAQHTATYMWITCEFNMCTTTCKWLKDHLDICRELYTCPFLL